MKVLAFLQNQWFTDVKSAAEIQQRMGRLEFISTFLFYRCPTGQQLTKFLGGEWCERIVWENTSTQIGDYASLSILKIPVRLCLSILCIRHMLREYDSGAQRFLLKYVK